MVDFDRFKPCPFCGGTNRTIRVESFDFKGYIELTYQCEDCDTKIVTHCQGNNIEKMYDKWNTRVIKETKMLREEPKRGEVWQHFKGTNYSILNIAINTETEEKMVVYQNEDNPFEKVWVRPMEIFMQEVDKEKYPGCEYKYRFTKLS